jgi:hypothetical protein
MKPVWIKYYGIIPMTKAGYLITLAVVGAFAALAMLAAAVFGTLPPLDTMWSRQHHLPGSGFGVFLYNYMYWVILACLVAQAVDTWTTLSVFAKKEAEQRAEQVVQSDQEHEGRPWEPL